MPAALTIAGHVRAFLHRRLREAMALHERALSLNPNLAMAWALRPSPTPIWATRMRRSGGTTATRSFRRSIRMRSSSTRFFILIHLLKRDYRVAPWRPDAR